MKKVTVHFEGNLTQFGDTFTLNAETVNDAIRSLVMQVDGLKEHVRKGYYRLKVGNKVITQSEYIETVALDRDCEIWLSPRIAGAGKAGTLIAGAVLTVIGGVLSYFGLGVIGVPLMKLGVGMMIGGVAQMLVKAPKFNQDYQGVDDSKSSAFTSLSNMVGQGKKIPRIYGNIRVGSVIVSQSVSSYRASANNAEIANVQSPTYEKKRISVIPLRAPNGQLYNVDTNSDSVRESATTISVKWS